MKYFIILIISISFSSCCFYCEDTEDDYVPYESPYEAVTIERVNLDSSIALLESQSIVKPSKIYIVNDYIFINDKLKGFHIFDNTDPANPIKKNFLKLPGATDIAIRDNILYINQATDLVTLSFDFDTFSFKVEDRIGNVFPELNAPDGSYENVNSDSVIVDWIEK